MFTTAELDAIEKYALDIDAGDAPATQDEVIELVNMARQGPRWIPTDEQLPDEGQLVIAWPDEAMARPVVAHRQRSDGALVWSADGGRRLVPDPAFWVPLPEPPA